VLKYQLIPTRTAGEKAFWYKTVDRQNDKPLTDMLTDKKGRYRPKAREPT